MGRLAVYISESEGCKVHAHLSYVWGSEWRWHVLVLWFPIKPQTHWTVCCVATREAKWISCLNIKLIMKGKSYLNLILSEACLQWFHSLLAAPAVPDSALPIGMEKEDGSTQLVPVEPSECIHLFHANYKCAGQAEYSWFRVVHCCSGDAHTIKSADLYRERFDYLCAYPHPQRLGPCRISHVVDFVSLDCCARGKIVKSLLLGHT